ncbi:hypothetical protein OG21DRAFT_1490665 [Imleria badia]|nr:hypothetical protein OG21DRAFT_1490665 [Imleria badia]
MNITFSDEEHSSQNPTPPRTPSPLPLPVPEPHTLPPTSSQPCPIISVDVPLQAHSRGHLSNADFATLVATIEDTHLAIPIDSYLDVESPYYELLHAYFQNERLRFVHTSVPDTPEFHLAWQVASVVHQRVCDSLLITMFQLGMLEFFRDVDRYLRELAGAPPSASRVPTLPTVPPPIVPVPEETPSPPIRTPSAASSSLLDSEELVILARVDRWWSRADGDASLTPSHPHFNKACFQCQALGHQWKDCSRYQCPLCLEWAPGHPQSSCPQRRTALTPSTLSRSTPSRSTPRRSNSTHSRGRRATSTHICPASRPNVPRSPPRSTWHPESTFINDDTSDDVLDDVAYANITSSPRIGSYDL